MLKVHATTQFERDLKKIKKQHKNFELLYEIVKKLKQQETLPVKNHDHSLIGNWHGHRECHITPDWLLIYQIDKAARTLKLMRTGSHSELFNK